MVKTFAFKLYGMFGSFVVPGFGRTVEEARVNLAKSSGKESANFCPEMVAEYETLDEFYAAEDAGLFA